MAKKEDTPGRISRRKYEEKHKAERKEKHKNFNAMLFKDECEEMERYCNERGISKADFVRYGFALIMEEEIKYMTPEHWYPKPVDGEAITKWFQIRDDIRCQIIKRNYKE